MKSKLFFLLFFFIIFVFPKSVFAIEDPTKVPNNKFGIHILFPDEVKDAAKLVNSSGGDWGYVTIPIQAGDKNLAKWQLFMDNARKLHVIPLIRLATEGDYFHTDSWRKPEAEDIVDFANFLNSLNWPTKNRYVIVFNEVNRSNEWGDTLNPSEYADLLHFTALTFKSLSPDFFIISAGLDNAAPTRSGQFVNEYSYLSAMDASVPGIFSEIDGIGSHSYPNPGFSKPASVQDRESIATFRYEQSLIYSITGKQLPVFITETGWTKDTVDEGLIGQYYQSAFTNVWNDNSVIAVTPFLLKAGAGPFTDFSFLDPNSNPSKEYVLYASLPKVKGTPQLTQKILGTQFTYKEPSTVKNYLHTVEKPLVDDKEIQSAKAIKGIIKWLLKL